MSVKVVCGVGIRDMWKFILKNKLTSFLISIGTANAILTIVFLAFDGKFNLTGKIDSQLAADIGTYLAGTSGTLWGVAGLIVLIQTLHEQKKTRLQQRFETTFFNALESLKARTESLEEHYINCFSKRLLNIVSENGNFPPRDDQVQESTPNNIGKMIIESFECMNFLSLENLKKTYVQDNEEYLARSYYTIIKILNSYSGEKAIYEAILSDYFSSELTALFFYFYFYTHKYARNP